MPRHLVVIFFRQAWQRQKEKAQALGFGGKSSDKHQ
jgi:hypothetical protein